MLIFPFLLQSKFYSFIFSSFIRVLSKKFTTSPIWDVSTSKQEKKESSNIANVCSYSFYIISNAIPFKYRFVVCFPTFNVSKKVKGNFMSPNTFQHVSLLSNISWWIRTTMYGFFIDWTRKHSLTKKKKLWPL